jgi:glycosyltransferase involved in cell wall biosynthesis
VFVYGGNLGKPQGIPFLIKCIRKCRNLDNVLFLIVGDGTEYHLLEEYINKYQQDNVLLMKRLPKNDYDNMVGACDVGMIFLDHRFTIPNFPSRLLSYLEYKMPVLCVTDVNCDMGSIASENGFGMWAPSNNVVAFSQCVNDILKKDIVSMGENGYLYLKQNYLVEHSYSQIMKHFPNNV